MTAIGFLGTGAIAAPMARALARDGHRITVSQRNAETATALAAAFAGISVAPNQRVLDRSEVIFLCLRPAVWREILTPLAFRPDHRIISVMATVPLNQIAAATGPTASLAATIPYAVIEHGGCPLPVAGDPEPLAALFGASNPILPQADEAALNAHFAASTLVTAALALLDTGAAWLAEQTGNATGAETYATALPAAVLASLQPQAPGRIAEEISSLATPNTLNLQMLEGLRAGGSFDALPDILTRIARSMDR